jgi:hypothetical protein
MTDIKTLPCIKCDNKKIPILCIKNEIYLKIHVSITCSNCGYEYSKNFDQCDYTRYDPIDAFIQDYGILIKEKQKEQEIINKEQAKIRGKNKRARAFDILVKLTEKETEIKKRIERIIRWGASLKD